MWYFAHHTAAHTAGTNLPILAGVLVVLIVIAVAIGSGNDS